MTACACCGAQVRRWGQVRPVFCGDCGKPVASDAAARERMKTIAVVMQEAVGWAEDQCGPVTVEMARAVEAPDGDCHLLVRACRPVTTSPSSRTGRPGFC